MKQSYCQILFFGLILLSSVFSINIKKRFDYNLVPDKFKGDSPLNKKSFDSSENEHKEEHEDKKSEGEGEVLIVDRPYEGIEPRNIQIEEEKEVR